MTNKIVIGLFAISIILAGVGFYIASFSSIQSVRPVTIATTPWEPFVGPDMESHGPLGNLVSETIYRMGYRPEFSYSSWDLCLDKAARQLVLGTFPGIKTKEREDTFAFSAPLVETEYVLFFNKEHIPELADGKVPADFEIENGNFRFGKVKGYEEWDELKLFLNAYYKGREDTVRFFNSVNEAFQALADNEIHFLPEGKLPGLMTVARPSLAADASIFGYIEADTLEANSLYRAKVGFHLLMKKGPGASSFLERFNETMQEVKKRSTYQFELNQVEKRRHAGVSQEVILQPLESRAFARIHQGPSGDRSISVPRGTRAVVLEWPEQFTRFQPSPTNVARCKIKLLNGPMAGRIVWVDSQAISLNN